jgi:hypothetical protein
MPTAEEYRAELDTSRAALRVAIESASGSWEQAPDGDDQWSPRAVAEHVIGAEYYFAKLVAAAMQGKETDGPDLSFASTSDAASAFEEAIEVADKAYRYVEDRDLEKPSELNAGDSYPGTIEGVLQLATWHLTDHAEQIAAAS